MGRKKIRGKHVTLSVPLPARQHKAFKRWARSNKRSMCGQAVKVIGDAMRADGVVWGEEGRTVPPRQDMDGREA